MGRKKFGAWFESYEYSQFLLWKMLLIWKVRLKRWRLCLRPTWQWSINKLDPYFGKVQLTSFLKSLNKYVCIAKIGYEINHVCFINEWFGFFWCILIKLSYKLSNCGYYINHLFQYILNISDVQWNISYVLCVHFAL